ncbi:endo-1,4-beta-xylanase [Actomonas aquatica]|uniref:Beta-xylanase n=1 Tax=Actomonas aquatica TaxID=2866162 RepID=A0ABZ1CCA2_9BACT|nr:endo-1,4-beta-xylanase [Opitutus sp. WL0086]WRQ89071.1 endo-1,4-beta-xylanase [Opitutus sp. WL0086]
MTASFRLRLSTFALSLLGTTGAWLHGQDLSHRQSTLEVQVTNQDDAPLQGATVQVEMLNPSFRFGTAVVYGELYQGQSEYDVRGLDALQTYFNSLTFGNYMKWTYVEGRPWDTTRATISDAMAFKPFNSDYDFRVRGHVTIWGASYQVPSDLRNQTDAAAAKTRIRNHVTEYHTELKDTGVVNFDLYNEHFHEREFIIEKAVPGSTNTTLVAEQAAEVAEWFKLAQQAQPAAQLFFNEYNILNFWQENDSDVIAYKNFVDAVRDAGGPVYGIGLQAHMDRYISKEQIKRRLDLLAAPMPATANHPDGLPGLRIEITELDINTNGWTSATPAQQAEVTANVLEGAFEHPSVDGVTIWGLRDSIHWRDNAIFFDDTDDSNWVIKPSGQVWVDRVKGTWWTDLNGLSDASGDFTGTVFKGQHRITVTYNGETQTFVRDLSSDQTLDVEFNTTPPDTSGSYLTNLSVRAPLDAGQNLSLGFVVDGGSKSVLARVAGPSLAAYNVSGTMPDPRLSVQEGPTVIAANDDWVYADIFDTANAVGGFPFVVDSKDAAVIANVSGSKTVEITGDEGGVILSEVYDPAASATGPRLVNVSALTYTGPGDKVLTAGFTVGGPGHARVLIRGVGPELNSRFGVPGVLANPQITVYDAARNVIATNDDWDASLATLMGDLGAFPLTAGSTDAALLLVVEAGGQGYTVQVNGADGGDGTALIEVYEVR